MSWEIGQWTAVEDSDFEFNGSSGRSDWILVRGGGLSRVIKAKFALVAGTPRLVGLEFDDGQPVAARHLREPRIPAIEAAFASYLSERTEQLTAVREHVDQEYTRELTDEEREDLHGTASVLDRIAAHDAAEEARLRELGDDIVLRPRGRGASPPTVEELAAFARELTRQRLAGRGAATRTAQTIGINRSTVYRWIEACREHDLLPKTEDE
ncbi:MULTISPECIES: hypothetical protein [unclassified Nocardioides]|uniref:hypothetical protein n=1 Tax=unclassified Nocardioides TaxID=2615069 RepID=UPI000056FDFB|nr:MULTISPECIES: hypothetical protein [unclassified Nocardioides]ABL81477.1 hypothetical protein Noca_1967 [Nocardioides sp. JS614]